MTLVGVGTCGFKENCFLSRVYKFLLDFIFVESSTATCETMEFKKKKKPRETFIN